MDFPSMVYLYRAQQALGFELKIVPALDDLSVPGERILTPLLLPTPFSFPFNNILASRR